MFSKCANPDCGVPFDYREGHFFRFHKSHLPEIAPPNTHSVQHLWLCGKCSRKYVLEYVDGHGVVMLHRMDISLELEQVLSVAAA
jgi:hypothetical protein